MAYFILPSGTVTWLFGEGSHVCDNSLVALPSGTPPGRRPLVATPKGVSYRNWRLKGRSPPSRCDGIGAGVSRLQQIRVPGVPGL